MSDLHQVLKFQNARVVFKQDANQVMIFHVALISAINSGPKMIDIFGKLEKLETQLLYPAIKILSKQSTTSPAISLPRVKRLSS